MEWGQILLVLLFLLFPLIQQLLERKGSPPTLPPPDPEEEARDASAPQREPPRAERSFAEEVGWSVEAAEEIAAESVVDEKQAAELQEMQRHLPEQVLPEAVRVSAPVVSLEPKHVLRPTSPLRRAVPEPSPAAPRRPAGAAAVGIRGHDDLRRAVLLSEILGPPKSLR
jgi:hypothetical protein